MPLLWVSLSFIGGIAFSSVLSGAAWPWLLLLLLSITAVFLEIKCVPRAGHPLLSRPLFRIPISLLLAAFALGGCRFQAEYPSLTSQEIAWYASAESIGLSGMVVSFPEESPGSTIAIVKAQTIRVGEIEQAVNGKLELRLPGGFNLEYGDVLYLKGHLDSLLDSSSPPTHSYLARRGIYSRMQYPQVTTLKRAAGSPIMAALFSLRARAQQAIYSQIPFPESALLSAILLGTDWNLPDYLVEAYRACGVLHIIAISGFNIAIISNLIIRLARRLFSPGKAGLFAIISILLYTLLVGGEPAVVRAAIMGSLAIPAHYFGRRVIPLHSLILVAALMLAGNPYLLWDIGFQLSFLACLGLITMVDPLLGAIDTMLEKRYSEAARRWWSPILLLVVTTLTAQFCVYPVLIQMNPFFSWTTLPANLTLIVIQPLLMALGGLATIVGLFLPAAGKFLGAAAWPLLAYCNRVALNFGFQAGTEIQIPPGSAWVTAILVAAALTYFSIQQIAGLAQSGLSDQ